MAPPKASGSNITLSTNSNDQETPKYESFSCWDYASNSIRTITLPQNAKNRIRYVLRFKVHAAEKQALICQQQRFMEIHRRMENDDLDNLDFFVMWRGADGLAHYAWRDPSTPSHCGLSPEQVPRGTPIGLYMIEKYILEDGVCRACIVNRKSRLIAQETKNKLLGTKGFSLL